MAESAETPASRRDAQAGGAGLFVGEIVVLGLVWAALLPLRQMIEPVSAAEHFACLIAPLMTWGILWGVGHLRTGVGSLMSAILVVLPAIIAAACSVFVPVVVDQGPELPPTFLIFFGVGCAIGAVVLRTLARPAGAVPEGVPRAVVWILAAGLACLPVASKLPDKPPLGEQGWYLTQTFVRDGLKFAAIVSVAILAGTGIRRRWGQVVERLVFASRRWRLLGVCAVVSFGLSVGFAYSILDHIAHIQDEIAILFQAKNFARGQLYAPLSEAPEFFEFEYVVQNGNKWYGKYFAVASLLFVPGVLVGMPWLVSPVLSVIALFSVYGLGRLCFGERVARVGAVLAAISPFWMLTFASMMAHPGCLMLIAAFMYCFVKAQRESRGWSYAALAGLAAGAAFNVRPLSLVVVSVCVGLMMWLDPRRARLGLGKVIAFALPAGLLLIGYFAYNKALTGDARLTPFEQWSSTDRIGFGPDRGMPYWHKMDRGHTVGRAIDNFKMNLDALGMYLQGWPKATLALCVLPLLTRPRRWGTFLLWAIAVAIPVVYSCYHASGVLFGPRYWAEAMPAYLLLTAAGLMIFRGWIAGLMRQLAIPKPVRATRTAMGALLVLLTVVNVVGVGPKVLNEYGMGLWGVDVSVREAVKRADVHNAVVLVKSMDYRQSKGAPGEYAAAFQLNSPNLDGPIVYARDLGPERNKKLGRLYPDRKFYRYVENASDGRHLAPIPRP